MLLAQLIRGENRLIVQPLLQKDGVTPLLVSSLTGAVLELRQGTTVKATFTLGTSPELRAAASPSALEFELTTAVSLALTKGVPLVFRWKLTVPDAGFLVDPAFADFTDVPMFIVAA